ncbi:MAG: alpha-1,2-fucosyltransferase [Shewanella sp. CG18_big_fil_WC_8_21_14_2_50_42_11]|uniref:alpha-1,2-fucosyltransferase n=1 Tax=Shewanella TaxID=22 RepID=UPI000C3AE8D9|nr:MULTISPECIES: alpha-1,2-fucosyltransferase [Shewanella]NCP72632.1 alpha-1,2-fucosyltransferase [Shewanella vesiculosa]PIQ02248.1 MAG: alpha-1,2-fucosyltransferase [Shewanella sp. CG18_big_fil_WC_8_21_14_2_50_42_11]
MIITKITGGLGNQLFQYAVGKAVSHHHNVPLKLDITAYETYKPHNGYRLDQFAINAEIANTQEIAKLKGANHLLAKVLRKAGQLNKQRYYSEKERTIYDAQVFAREECYLDGYWQNEQYFLKIRDIFLQDITPKFSLSNQAQAYQRQIMASHSVSLHVRRGDYLNHPEIGVLDISYYQQAHAYMVSKVEDPVFYIFSNNLAWCKQNFKFIENAVYIEGTQTEIDDLMLMSQCQHNIIANSSFSWWGAWLNDNSNKIVIAPKRWMAVNPKGYKWSSNDWVEI